MIRPSIAFLFLVSLGLIGLTGICTQATVFSPVQKAFLEEMKKIVIEYGLTDICLFTEARYTRHPSMADVHSAFQDHPGALDHFPTGSYIPPPHHLRAPAWIFLAPIPPGKFRQDSSPDISSSWEASETTDLHARNLGKLVPWTQIWRLQAKR